LGIAHAFLEVLLAAELALVFAAFDHTGIEIAGHSGRAIFAGMRGSEPALEPPDSVEVEQSSSCWEVVQRNLGLELIAVARISFDWRARSLKNSEVVPAFVLVEPILCRMDTEISVHQGAVSPSGCRLGSAAIR